MEPDIANPPKRGWSTSRIVTVTLSAVFFITWGPYLMCTAWMNSHAFYLDKAVSVVSPDGRLKFEAHRNGFIQIAEISSGKIIQKSFLSPKDIYHVDAKWHSNREVEISGKFRYISMAPGVWMLWNQRAIQR